MDVSSFCTFLHTFIPPFTVHHYVFFGSHVGLPPVDASCAFRLRLESKYQFSLVKGKNCIDWLHVRLTHPLYGWRTSSVLPRQNFAIPGTSHFGLSLIEILKVSDTEWELPSVSPPNSKNWSEPKDISWQKFQLLKNVTPLVENKTCFSCHILMFQPTTSDATLHITSWRKDLRLAGAKAVLCCVHGPQIMYKQFEIPSLQTKAHTINFSSWNDK